MAQVPEAWLNRALINREAWIILPLADCFRLFTVRPGAFRENAENSALRARRRFSRPRPHPIQVTGAPALPFRLLNDLGTGRGNQMTGCCFQSVSLPDQPAPGSTGFPADFGGQILKLPSESSFIITVRMAGELR